MIFRQIINKKKMGLDEVLALLDKKTPRDVNALFEKAVIYRDKYYGKEIQLRHFIDLSTICSRNCNWCAFRNENEKLQRFRMSANDVVETIGNISNKGTNEIILKSGIDTEFDKDVVAYIIYSAKQRKNIKISLCLGDREPIEYKEWKIAGADKYLVNFTGTYEKRGEAYLKSQSKTEAKLNSVKYLKKLGYRIGVTYVIGLPGQKVENIAEDLLLFRDLNIDFLLFNMYHPTFPDEFNSRKSSDIELGLKSIAVGRLLLKYSEIPYLTDLYTPFLLRTSLNAGANVILNNSTPDKYLEMMQKNFNSNAHKTPESSSLSV